MRRPARATTALTLLLAAACGAGDPAASAEAFARAELAGDVVRMRALVSPADSAVLANPRDSAAAWWLAAAVKPAVGWAFDSSAVVTQADDSARVALFWTVPNWNGVEYSALRENDPAAAANRPRVTQVDTLTLVRIGRPWARAWRVDQDLRFRSALAPVRLMMYNEAAPVSARRAAIAQLRAAYDSSGRELGDWSAVYTDLERSLAWTDSLTYSLSIETSPLSGYGLATRQVAGTATNRSSRPIARAMIRFVMTSGETGTAEAYDIPPGGTAQLMGFGTWKGQLQSHQLVEAEPVAAGSP